MTKQQIANPMLKDFPWDGSELVAPLTLPGALLAPSYVEQKQIATPANPPAGSLRLYPKSDGKYYQLDSAGNEMIISGMTQAQTDGRYLPLTGGTLTGPLTVAAGITAQSIVASGTVTADGIVANTYKWTPASDGESLYKEMPGRLRLSGAQLTVDQNVNVGTYTQLAEIASPVTPNTGFLRLYGKSDHRLYVKNTSGTEEPLLTQTLANTLYDVLGTAVAGDTAHVAATDPHPVYLTAIEGDARYATNPGGPSGGYLTIASAAATYLPLVGGTLTGNLLFSTDNTRDIGASGATRPRDLFLGRNAVVGGNVSAGVQFLAAVGTSAAPGYSFGGGNTGTGMYLPAAGILTLVAAQNVVASISNGSISLDGNVVFTYDNTRDIGASGATRPRNLYLAGAATIGGAATISGNIHGITKLQLDGGNIWMGPNQPVTPDLGLYSTTGANWMRLANAAMPIKFYVDAAASNNWIGASPMGEFNTSGFSISGSFYYGGQPFITWGGEQLQWAATGGGFRWVNQANTVQWMALDTSANLSVAGQVIAGAAVSAYAGGVWANSFFLGGSGSYYINVSSNICQIVNMNLLSWGWVGLASNAGIYINWDGTGISHTHQIRGPSLYVSGRMISNNWDIGSANSLGGELYVNGGITLYSGAPLYMESGRNVYMAWRGDLRSVYVPYDLGIYTTRVLMSRLDWEGSRQVYFNWDGSNVTMNMSGPWGFGAPNLFSGTTNAMNIVCSYGAAGGYICWQDSNVRLLRTGNQILWWVYDGVWDFRSTASGNQAGYIDMSGFHSTSKRRYKTDITPIKDGLKLVMDERVTPIRYSIKGYGILRDKPSLGFIAEDMAHVVPNAVGRDEEGPSSINYGSLVAVLWDAVRTLNTRVEELEEKLAA